MSSDLSWHLPRAASIRFLTTVEGGRFSAPVSGIRPQLDLEDGTTTSCMVERVGPREEIPLGVEVEVLVSILNIELARDAYLALRAIRLYEGLKLVAVGRFIDQDGTVAE